MVVAYLTWQIVHKNVLDCDGENHVILLLAPSLMYGKDHAQNSLANARLRGNLDAYPKTSNMQRDEGIRLPVYADPRPAASAMIRKWMSSGSGPETRPVSIIRIEIRNARPNAKLIVKLALQSPGRALPRRAALRLSCVARAQAKGRSNRREKRSVPSDESPCISRQQSDLLIYE